MKKADVILIISIVIATVIAYVLIINTRTSGDRVEIVISGQVQEEFLLSEDQVYEITTDSGVNTLVIENGQAYMSAADCKDGICMDHSPVSKNGETIICLPHKVVVRVVSGSQSEVDGVLN